VLALLATAACGRYVDRSMPRAYLFQRAQYQALYGPDGRILRLLYDGNADHMADSSRSSVRGPAHSRGDDLDKDGAIDRWESYAASGALESVATARRKPGVPDLWEYLGPKGEVRRRELDENGDGVPHRTEQFEDGRLSRVALDSDGDGRPDRWQEWLAACWSRRNWIRTVTGAPTPATLRPGWHAGPRTPGNQVKGDYGTRGWRGRRTGWAWVSAWAWASASASGAVWAWASAWVWVWAWASESESAG